MGLDKANIKRDDSPDVEGHMPLRRAVDEADQPVAENDDPQAVESSNILRPPTDEPDVEGHMPFRRANEEGPQQETDDPQLQDGSRKPRGEEEGDEPDVEAHKFVK